MKLIKVKKASQPKNSGLIEMCQILSKKMLVDGKWVRMYT